MNDQERSNVSDLRIPAELKRRAPGRFLRTGGWVLFIILLLGVGIYVLEQRQSASLSSNRSNRDPAKPGNAGLSSAHAAPPQSPTTTGRSGADSNVVLTASGYIIVRERIELGPKLSGTVTWLGVDKGDKVKKGQVIAKLEDAEYKARFLEAEGKLALAHAVLTNAVITQRRQEALNKTDIGTDQELDDANRAVDVARAQVLIAQGQLALAQTHVNWCTIESPIDGVVLEKYVDQEELVLPQAFGGEDHPSTLLVALADLKDLQVEIDLNEQDTPKVTLNQKCRIRPEAYRDKTYQGHVAEISPEADRQKGTLQVKIRIDQPDQFLVPELNARVDFLRR